MFRFCLVLSLLTGLIIVGCERPTEVSPDDGVPPAVPTGLYVRFDQDGTILIQWDNNYELDFNHYNIYRAINKSAFSLLISTTDSYFYDDSLNYHDVYYYKITAVDSKKLESNFTDTVSGRPVNKLPPGIPARDMLLVNGHNDYNMLSVNLTWSPNDDGDMDHYLIFRDSLTDNFIPDSSNLIGTSIFPSFTDTTHLSFYKKYYYKLKAVDKGGMVSKESNTGSDLILEIPKIIFPENSSRVPFFANFLVKAISVPARYRIIVQTNRYFGEIWSYELSTNIVNDTLRISFNPYYIEPNITYYWRVAAFTGDNTDPNSVTDLFQFVIKP